MSKAETNGSYMKGNKGEEAVALTAGSPGDTSLSLPGSVDGSSRTGPGGAEDELHDGCIVLGKYTNPASRHS